MKINRKTATVSIIVVGVILSVAGVNALNSNRPTHKASKPAPYQAQKNVPEPSPVEDTVQEETATTQQDTNQQQTGSTYVAPKQFAAQSPTPQTTYVAPQPTCSADMRSSIDDTHQANIDAENARYSGATSSITADYQARGLGYSGLLQNALNNESTNHANKLQSIDAQYSQQKAQYGC